MSPDEDPANRHDRVRLQILQLEHKKAIVAFIGAVLGLAALVATTLLDRSDNSIDASPTSATTTIGSLPRTSIAPPSTVALPPTLASTAVGGSSSVTASNAPVPPLSTVTTAPAVEIPLESAPGSTGSSTLVTVAPTSAAPIESAPGSTGSSALVTVAPLNPPPPVPTTATSLSTLAPQSTARPTTNTTSLTTHGPMSTLYVTTVGGGSSPTLVVPDPLPSRAFCDAGRWASAANELIRVNDLATAWHDPDGDCLDSKYESGATGTNPHERDSDFDGEIDSINQATWYQIPPLVEQVLFSL